jgi:formate dehydrogenase major subunit
MPRLTIDAQPVDVADGCSILDAARAAGIEVPNLCADPRLEPSGACRLCVVRVDDAPRPVAACTTPVRGGMVVLTGSPELEAYRRTLLRLLARPYPASALRESTSEPFHQLLARYGLSGETAARTAGAVDDSHPTIHVDLSRCISCWRCVRICEDVQGQFVWRIADRGASSRIVPDSGTTLADSSCVACGACVDTCPTGALEDRSVLELGAPQRWTRTTCPYCGVGCELNVGVRDGRITAATPALDAPVNRGHLCVKGRAGHGFVTAPDRVTSPMLRRGGDWVTASWDEAIDAVAATLHRILGEHGPQAVGVLGSARATNEDNYLVQRFARTVIGTNNVDCCARVCHAPSAAALKQIFGTGAATSSFDDIEQARTILVWGSNTTENHPVVGARIKQAARRGARLIVVDPRRIELCDQATLHLQPRPGTNLLLLHAMAYAVLDEGLADDAFLAARAEGLTTYRAFLEPYAPERVAEAAGVEAGAIRAAARLFATARPAISFHGLGLTEHQQGTDGVLALANLALLTGNLGRRGAGVNPLRGQNNVQGAAHMGCEPAHLPGYAPLAEARDRVAAVWRTEIPAAPGLDAMEMLDAAAAGRLKALWVVGWDLLLTQPNAQATRAALANLELLVVQDLFLNETARELGSVFLPVACSFEKDGTFMNSERRVQRVRKALDPPGDAKPDWEVTTLAARAMGDPSRWAFQSPEEVWEEIRQVWAPGAGISYSRLAAAGGLQWPCPDEQHPGTQILHERSFPGLGPRARLAQVDHRPGAERSSAELPLVLVTGRGLYQFNAGTMTRRAATNDLCATDYLELSAADADRRGVRTGTRVRVRSRYGETQLPAQVTARVPPGVVFATFSDPAVSINLVTGPHRDDVTNTPEYKVTAVEVDVA